MSESLNHSSEKSSESAKSKTSNNSARRDNSSERNDDQGSDVIANTEENKNLSFSNLVGDKVTKSSKKILSKINSKRSNALLFYFPSL